MNNLPKTAREWLADHADVRTLGDALCFLICGACTVAIGAMVAYMAGWRP